MRWFKRKNLFQRKERTRDIAPDEIFLDSSNLPAFDINQFEGRLEHAVSQWVFFSIAAFCMLVGVLLLGRVWNLQVVHGDVYLSVSEENRLDHEIIFARRGVITDRRGVQLAWNEPSLSLEDLATTTVDAQSERTFFTLRHYYEEPGLSHVLGYVSYPQKDASGFYFQEETKGVAGVEAFYNELLGGENGRRLTETNAVGEKSSQATVYEPVDGEHLVLSIDAPLQTELYQQMESLREDIGFAGGGAVVLDVATGEVLALTSAPEYNGQIMTDGDNADAIQSFLTDPSQPFLNRVVGGLYTPGSIIKPFIAVGSLAEHVIDPEKELFSSGALEVPNPYDPDHPTIFKDWKAHGWVDMRHALAVSSNVYFYQVGGGSPKGVVDGVEHGLGILGIGEYVHRFGIGESTGIDLPGEVEGTVPSPAWKEEHFPGDPWRVGDTYNTSIGQYGFQVTPLQMARAVAAIANGGFLVEPHLLLDERVAPRERVRIADEDLEVVREGMRQAVLEGTAKGLGMSQVAIAAKTGTAELGQTKQKVNSWVIGFFPYEHPRYAFAAVMEQGPATNLIGALFVMRRLFDWMSIERPEYFEG